MKPPSSQPVTPNVTVGNTKPSTGESIDLRTGGAIHSAANIDPVTVQFVSEAQDNTALSSVLPLGIETPSGSVVSAIQTVDVKNEVLPSLLPVPQAQIRTASTALMHFSQYRDMEVVRAADFPMRIPLSIEKMGFASDAHKSPVKSLVLQGPTQTGKTVEPKIVNPKQKLNKQKGEALGILRVIYHRVEREFNEKEDLGSQSIGMSMLTGELALAYFKTAQKATEGTISVVKGTVDAVKTAGKAEAAFKLASEAIKLSGVTPISLKGYKVLRESAKVIGLKETSLGMRIVHRVKRYEDLVKKSGETYKKVKNGIQAVKVTVATGYQSIKTAANAVRNLRKAGVPLTREHIRQLRQNVFRGAREKIIYTAKATGKAVAKGTLKGSAALAKSTGKAVVKGGKLAGKGALNAANAIAGGLMASEDMALQGVGYAYTASRLGLKVGIKTAKVGFRGTKVGIKTAVKGSRGISRGVQFLRKNGIRASVRRLGSGITNGIAQAGKSVVSAVLQVAKAAAVKLMIPFLIAIAAALGIVAVSGAVSTVGTMFGGVFSDKDSGAEVDVAQYLGGQVSTYASAEQARVVGEMQASKKPSGPNDIVRVYGAGSTDTLVEPSVEAMADLFPTNAELVNALGPVFNAVLLMDYELEPTSDEANALVGEMASGIFRCDPDAAHTEYCGQDLKTGAGTVVRCRDCNKVHAIKTGANACPNCKSGVHTTYTAKCCCKLKYRCKGHKTLTCTRTDHVHNDGCYNETFHRNLLTTSCGNAERVNVCSGYNYCDGHTVTHYRFSADGMYMVGNRYFDQPIEAILAIPAEDRTPEEVAKLSDLQSYREIYLEMMSQFSLVSGGGMTMADLSDVAWIPATNRTGNQAVIDLALSQVGITGGYPYWSYYGFGSRVAWCGCFVHWCMRHTPSATNAWPDTGNNAYIPSIHSWFNARGRFMPRTYRNLVPGDVILFDWQPNGSADHVGLVIGRDSQYVYTVEGNSGDAVKVWRYDMNSVQILGYCRMDY